MVFPYGWLMVVVVYMNLLKIISLRVYDETDSFSETRSSEESDFDFYFEQKEIKKSTCYCLCVDVVLHVLLSSIFEFNFKWVDKNR